MFLDDTIAAIATAPGEAGIGIVRISGEKSIEIADRIFISKVGKKLSQYNPRRITYGYIIDPDKNEKIDEVLVSQRHQVHIQGRYGEINYYAA